MQVQSYVFHGPEFRLRLTVYLTDKPVVSVWRLPQTWDKATDYAEGAIDYLGSDMDQAWDALERHVPDLLAQCPAELILRLRQQSAKRCGVAT